MTPGGGFDSGDLGEYEGRIVVDEAGVRVGKVTSVYRDPDTLADYLIVDRPPSPDTAVPLELARPTGDGGLRLPLAVSFVDDAPNVDLDDGTLSRDDQARIDRFYVRHAA